MGPRVTCTAISFSYGVQYMHMHYIFYRSQIFIWWNENVIEVNNNNIDKDEYMNNVYNTIISILWCIFLLYVIFDSEKINYLVKACRPAMAVGQQQFEPQHQMKKTLIVSLFHCLTQSISIWIRKCSDSLFLSACMCVCWHSVYQSLVFFSDHIFFELHYSNRFFFLSLIIKYINIKFHQTDKYAKHEKIQYDSIDRSGQSFKRHAHSMWSDGGVRP